MTFLKPKYLVTLTWQTWNWFGLLKEEFLIRFDKYIV